MNKKLCYAGKELKMYKKKLACSLILSVLILALSSCTDTSVEPVTKTGFYFDTVISITLYGQEKTSYIDKCFDLAETYESYFSTTIETSDVAQINSHIGEPVTVHEETVELIRKGMDYYETSNGKFDITIGKLTSLWDFSGGENNVPSSAEIESYLPSVDASGIVIDKNTVMLTRPDSAIDLGGIAKGYIADRMKEYLNSQGITSGTINLGGNVLVLGPKEYQDKKTYTIGIQEPFAQDGTSIAAVTITDESVVTSGIYQRYFEKDGVLYHHILDPDTGYPCENDLASVTIINHSSVDGDALSTVCFMMGLEKGMDYVESLDDTEAIFITRDGDVYYTTGIGTKIPFELLK